MLWILDWMSAVQSAGVRDGIFAENSQYGANFTLFAPCIHSSTPSTRLDSKQQSFGMTRAGIWIQSTSFGGSYSTSCTSSQMVRRSTSPNTEIPTTMVWPRDKNVFGKISEKRGEYCWLHPRERDQLRTRWSDYISDLAWPRVSVESAELLEIPGNREGFRVLLGLLIRLPSRGKAYVKINEWISIKF